MITTLRRRWSRFSLRTLFVVVTALACWLGYSLNWSRQRQAVLAKVRDQTHAEHSGINAPPMLRFLGEVPVSWIAVGEGYSKTEFERIKSLFPEAKTMRDAGHPDQIFVVFVYSGPEFAASGQR